MKYHLTPVRMAIINELANKLISTSRGMDCGRKTKIYRTISVLRDMSYSLDLVSATSSCCTVLLPPSPLYCPSHAPGRQPLPVMLPPWAKMSTQTDLIK